MPGAAAKKFVRDAAIVQPNATARSFLDSLTASNHQTWPYDYWLLENVLPKEDVADVLDLPFAPPADAALDGRRESNNATRVFFNLETQAGFAVCRRIVDAFQHPAVRDAIATETRADLSDGHLRIEYCQDSPGFWLEPHTDIAVKKLTMLIYLSDDPGLANAGTDIHEGPPDHKYVVSAPYGRNRGLIFVPGHNTWHGVGHHRVTGLRRSLIINYVTSAWRQQDELA